MNFIQFENGKIVNVEHITMVRPNVIEDPGEESNNDGFVCYQVYLLGFFSPISITKKDFKRLVNFFGYIDPNID